MGCPATLPEKTSTASLHTKNWKIARLTARIASTAHPRPSTKATARPCTTAMGKATVAVEVEEAALAADRGLRKLSVGREAVQRQMIQTCKVTCRHVCPEHWIVRTGSSGKKHLLHKKVTSHGWSFYWVGLGRPLISFLVGTECSIISFLLTVHGRNTIFWLHMPGKIFFNFSNKYLKVFLQS